MDFLFEGRNGNVVSKAAGVRGERLFAGGTARSRRYATVLLFPATTLFLVAATLEGERLTTPLLLSVLVLGVVLLGLPHGGLDPLVARQRFAEDSRFTMPRFLLAYLLAAVVSAAGWLAFPSLGLISFLIISALHFGSDWQDRGRFWGRTAYGATVITVSTLHFPQAVRLIYLQLGVTSADGIVGASRVVAVVAGTLALLSLVPQRRVRWRDGLELCVIVIGGLFLQPLIFFICYFCLLHSPRHLAETAREVGLRGLAAIVKAVAPVVLATLVVAAWFWRFLPQVPSGGRILQLVFIGLAALTVPHMILTSMKRGHSEERESVRETGTVHLPQIALEGSSEGEA